MYAVRIFNDEETTFEFVHSMLMDVFRMSDYDSDITTSDLDANNWLTIGNYTREDATARVTSINEVADIMGFPLHAEVVPI